jgi:hypothetical protein
MVECIEYFAIQGCKIYRNSIDSSGGKHEIRDFGKVPPQWQNPQATQCIG